jgi:hypothetical protein
MCYDLRHYQFVTETETITYANINVKIREYTACVVFLYETVFESQT